MIFESSPKAPDGDKVNILNFRGLVLIIDLQDPQNYVDSQGQKAKAKYRIKIRGSVKFDSAGKDLVLWIHKLIF